MSGEKRGLAGTETPICAAKYRILRLISVLCYKILFEFFFLLSFIFLVTNSMFIVIFCLSLLTQKAASPGTEISLNRKVLLVLFLVVF